MQPSPSIVGAQVGNLRPGDSTLSGSSDVHTTSDREAEIPALVLVWSHDEPSRVGELFAPPRSPGLWFTVGRAVEPDDDGAFPLSLLRLRPFEREDTGPLRSSRVSRREVRLRLAGDHSFDIERLGRHGLRVNGHDVAKARISPGDLIEVERRFSLLCTVIPRSWPHRERPPGVAPFAFGQADTDGLVGESPAMWTLRTRLAQVGNRDEHVLVLGPSGAGKELVARALHRHSRRGKGPLIARNAATIPETLIDAELFGNLKNYPNPGMPERDGLIGSANDGTLFLDEIGELPTALQAHLLRVLDSGEYQRLGESTVRRAALRMVAATNRPASQLKHDLLARFGHRIDVPGLDERPSDIPLIVRHLAHTHTLAHPNLRLRFFTADEPRVAAELVHALVAHPFVAHVREVSEFMLRALTSDDAWLRPPPGLESRPATPPTATVAPADLTREQVLKALDDAGNVREQAWRALGLRNRYQFRRLLQQLGID